MKIDRKRQRNPLRYGFYIVLILFLLFVGAGLINRTIETESYTKINYPIQKVKPYMSDEELIAKWIGKINNSEIVQGKQNELGSVYRLTFTDGQTGILTLAERESEIGTYAFEVESDITRSNIRISLDSSDSLSTDVRQIVNIEGKDLLTRSILMFLKNMYQKESYNNLNRLKNEVEKS